MMKTTSKGWQRLVDLGSNEGSPPLARLIYLCDVGEIDQHLSAYLVGIADEMDKLKAKLDVTDSLLTERDRVMAAIPECDMHGSQCVPHALEWIETMKSKTDGVHNVQ